MRTAVVGILAFMLAGGAIARAQNTSESAGLLSRRYEDGATLVYRMKGRNDGSTYEVRLMSVVRKHPDGYLFEEYAWSDLIANGQPRVLSPAMREFRAAIRLSKGSPPFAPPDLSRVIPLIGPITDLMTFYVDLFLAIDSGELRRAGDRILVPSPATGSWADGARVLIGESAVDFDISLASFDQGNGLATLIVRHIPPTNPKVQLPADWMRRPIAGTANNYIQVTRAGTGYVASVGKETFDVALTISLKDGSIISATMENTVKKIDRECRDAALTNCGEPRDGLIQRRIAMTLEK